MRNFISIFFIIFFFYNCTKENALELSSPDYKIDLKVEVTNGHLKYLINYKDSVLFKPSNLGYLLKDSKPLNNNFLVLDSKISSSNSEWTQVWGENKTIKDQYNKLVVFLQEKVAPFRKMNVVFKVYNDGVGFRYEIPMQENLDSIFITDELTEFNFSKNFNSWFTPANFDSYEQLYTNAPLNSVESANTPITFESDYQVFVSIHEANLTDYAGMTLLKNKEKEFSFKSNLVPWPNGVKVKTSTPMFSPWRTIQIAEKATDLVASNLILNLNEPNKLVDTSWIKPMKYIGIWWGMHLGVNTWTLGERHGATTKATKEYIDFAADNNISGVLVEGWNRGWEHWGQKGAFDFVTPYSDFNLKEIAAYAKAKNINFIGHIETGGAAQSFEDNLEKVFSMYQDLGVKAVKTGYAGGIHTKGQFHHGQFMVKHYRKVVEAAAKYQIMVNAHEPIKPTGIRRTYPNMMTREGARGMEWNAWSSGNPPDHYTIIPFTRGLAGPFDYTPGTFDILFENSKNRVNWNNADLSPTRVHTTLAKQLSLFVILYSPLQMASDLIENYKNETAFKFIKDFGVDWETSKVINGKKGDYITIARKEKNSENWFLGSCTDENIRELEIELSFLDADKQYVAEIYADGPNADWKTNPQAIKIFSEEVNSKTILKLKLAAGGGQAIKFTPIN